MNAIDDASGPLNLPLARFKLRYVTIGSWRKLGATWVECLRTLADHHPNHQQRMYARWVLTKFPAVDSLGKAHSFKAITQKVCYHYNGRLWTHRAMRRMGMPPVELFVWLMCMKHMNQHIPRELGRLLATYL